jgi:hypothetical protein
MKAVILMLLVTLFAFANIGTVMALKGKATLKRTTIMVLKTGMSIKQGDSIMTKRASRVQVMLKDDTVVTIGANSSFDFKTFRFKNKNSKVDFKANKGFIRIVTGKIGKLAPKRFQVKTTTAIIGIRGTDFSANIMPNKEIIQCYSGSIWVKLYRGGVKNLDADMLLEITKKSAKLKNAVTGMPITKDDAVDISDVIPDVTKPTESNIHQERPIQPNDYNDYPY